MSSIPNKDIVYIGDFTKWMEGRESVDYCLPKPMSDDVLDSGVQYLKFSRELLGVADDE